MSDDGDLALLTEPASLRLDGQVVWVTGASRGLGRSLAYALAGVGAEVVLTARSEEPLRAAAEEIVAHGGRAFALAGSVADRAEVERVVSAIAERWGKLDVLVNNAGMSTAFKRSELVEDDEWQRVLDVNLFGPFACCRAALPLLEKAAHGSIVNVSSVHGTVGHERLAAYAASKGGLEMLTRTLAIEWAGRDIRVNAIAPGYFETDMTAALIEHPRWGEALRARIPLGRFATTGEIVGSVLFLASPLSRYITGTTLFVDGGWTAQ